MHRRLRTYMLWSHAASFLQFWVALIVTPVLLIYWFGYRTGITTTSILIFMASHAVVVVALEMLYLGVVAFANEVARRWKAL